MRDNVVDHRVSDALVVMHGDVAKADHPLERAAQRLIDASQARWMLRTTESSTVWAISSATSRPRSVRIRDTQRSMVAALFSRTSSVAIQTAFRARRKPSMIGARSSLNDTYSEKQVVANSSAVNSS
ncbi:MAG: hypothetical protein RL354_542 [Planctomycetota bacterium]|jgi:hypothetical protein